MHRVQTRAQGVLLFEPHAQSPHVNVDRPLVAVEIVAPDSLQQHVARQRDSRVRRQRYEQSVLARFETYVAAVDAYFTRGLIDLEPSKTAHARRTVDTHPAAPQDRANSCDHLSGGKRFDDVVIGAELEADDPVHFIGARGDHDNPIEYTHTWLRSIVTQYEVGRDVASFAEGIRGALRADPDVLFIGELRGVDTVGACLQAAETGHVVFAALHTPSESAHAVNRIIGLFPSAEQETARARLADSLRALVGLRLVPLQNGLGLRVAAEIAVANDAVRRVIRDGAVHQLRATLVTGRREGMQTLEAHLTELVAAGDIDVTVARAASQYPEEVRDRVSAGSLRR